jgi:hypothetical protein
MQHKIKYSHIVVLTLLTTIILSCNNKELSNKMKEKQITFNAKTHALDNNDNFSPDGKFLCYDTRGMVFNNNLANSKSIEKVEIATGVETVLWEPESVSGENGAPGVAAVSYHPTENKVIFIHGPLLEEVEERGYYDIRNRTGVEVSADGKGKITKVDMRDVEVTKPTIPGAQRGGTHRHEYSRNGKRVGFTYDDFIQQDYDRSIGYMEENANAPEGYTHYFAVLLKPVKKGTSKPGEIEKAYSDAWVDREGTKRAFIGKVRSENGVDYETSLFVAEIPDEVDITSAYSGDKDTYPNPPKGVKIRRLTHNRSDDGIVRGSYDGKKIAYLSKDKNGIKQVFVIPEKGSDQDQDPKMHPIQITHFNSDASNIRWHSSDHWIFSISKGLIYASFIENNDKFGTTVLLTEENLERGNLVVSPDGNMLAYNIDLPVKKDSNKKTEDAAKKYKQVFILKLDWDQIKSKLNK